MHLYANAKINLTLDVLGRRKDGFHELCGVMHSCDLHDDVYVSFLPGQKNDVSFCGDFSASIPHDNTVTKALRLYSEAAQLQFKDIDFKVNVVKSIPSESGLGGASADAAAVLFALHKHYNAFDDTKLFELAARVGADVPFCLLGGCALAQGIGEKLTPLPVQELTLLLARCKSGISTAALFHSLGCNASLSSPCKQVFSSVEACRAHNNKLLCASLYNALEAPALEHLPDIGTTKQHLLSSSALSACMTGSGSAVYGIFKDEATCQDALTKLPHHLLSFTRITKTAPAGIIIAD